MSSAHTTTDLERQSLEAHVDLCAIRYEQLDKRLTKVEQKIDAISSEMKSANTALVKVIVGAAGTITSGLLGTIVVMLMKL
jgi:tetrahydromethanopterin S-methyltransferase subunit G